MNQCDNMIRHSDEISGEREEGDAGAAGAAAVDHIVSIVPPAAGDTIATLGLTTGRGLTTQLACFD
jgi:hypothetical protein